MSCAEVINCFPSKFLRSCYKCGTSRALSGPEGAGDVRGVGCACSWQRSLKSVLARVRGGRRLRILVWDGCGRCVVFLSITWGCWGTAALLLREQGAAVATVRGCMDSASQALEAWICAVIQMRVLPSFLLSR